MARNLIQYEGRIINNNGQSKAARSRQGNVVVQLVVAEQFQEKNKNAPQEYRQPTAGPDDYVNTTTAWHRLTVLGPLAEKIATDPMFGHGAIVQVAASYREEAPWQTKDGVLRAGRAETIFSGGDDDQHDIYVKAKRDGTLLGPRDEWRKPLWDGRSDLPGLGGNGGGVPPAPEYSDDEGF